MIVRFEAVFQCSKCSNQASATQAEMAKYGSPYGWLTIPNDPNHKGMDQHVCPACRINDAQQAAASYSPGGSLRDSPLSGYYSPRRFDDI